MGGSCSLALKRLQERKRGLARPSLACAQAFVGQVGAGLRCLHGYSIAHLDIKLENLLVSDQNALGAEC